MPLLREAIEFAAPMIVMLVSGSIAHMLLHVMVRDAHTDADSREDIDSRCEAWVDQQVNCDGWRPIPRQECGCLLGSHFPGCNLGYWSRDDTVIAIRRHREALDRLTVALEIEQREHTTKRRRKRGHR